MATGTGIDRQIGYVAESSYGVGATVSRFLPAISETMTKDIGSMESAGQVSGQKMLRSCQWTQGYSTISGDIQHELHQQSIGLLLRTAFGTVTTSGTVAPYTHTFFPADKTTSLTVQVGRPTTYGTVIPFTYTGAKIQSWEIGISPGEIVTWGMSVVAQDETMGTALATASYATDCTPWNAKDVTVKVDGTIVPAKGLTFAGANNMTTDRRFIGSTVIAEPLQGAYTDYTGSLDVEFGNPSSLGTLLYNKFLTGGTAAVTATLASGTLSGTITANVRFTGTTPTTSDSGIVMHNLPFKCFASGTLDSSAIQVVLQNNDATA